MNQFGLETLPQSTDKQLALDQGFDALAKPGYLPRLELKGSNSDAVKEEKVPLGYALTYSKTNMKGLGKSINIVPIAYRLKATSLNGDAPISNYDHTSKTFRDIVAQSEVKDSKCIYGPEFLVYIQDVGLATLHCKSKSERNVAPKIKDRLRQGLTLKVGLAENKLGKWNVIVPEDFDGNFPIDVEKVKEELEKFENPKNDEAPEAAAPTTQRER